MTNLIFVPFPQDFREISTGFLFPPESAFHAHLSSGTRVENFSSLSADKHVARLLTRRCVRVVSGRIYTKSSGLSNQSYVL